MCDIPNKVENEQLIGILDSVIQLNPYFRKSAKECLALQYFDDVRDK